MGNSEKIEKAPLTKDQVEVYSMFGDMITKLVLSTILILLFIALLGYIIFSISNGACNQVWWLTTINVTLGFGLRSMFKHFYK